MEVVLKGMPRLYKVEHGDSDNELNLMMLIISHAN